MSIFMNNLKRIFKSKLQLFFIILFPLAFMSMGFLGYDQSIKVAVIDHDQTQLTRSLYSQLETKASLSSIKELDIEKKLMELKVDYVIVIDKGFSSHVISGEGGKIKAYSVKESNLSTPISSFLDQFVTDTKMIAKAVNHDELAFYQAFNQYIDGKLNIKNEVTVNKEWMTSRGVMGFVVISMLYTSVITALLIISNKNNGTFYRTLYAPVRLRNYMLQNIGSFLVVALFQVSFIILVLQFGFKLYLGNSAWNMFLILAIFSLVSVSIGVAISSFSKNMIQANIIGLSAIPPMAMLGGAYFPNDTSPEIIKTLSQFVPVTWVMDGVEQLLQGQSISTLGKDMWMLLLFACIFFLLGAFKKASIAK